MMRQHDFDDKELQQIHLTPYYGIFWDTQRIYAFILGGVHNRIDSKLQEIQSTNK